MIAQNTSLKNLFVWDILAQDISMICFGQAAWFHYVQSRQITRWYWCAFYRLHLLPCSYDRDNSIRLSILHWLLLSSHPQHSKLNQRKFLKNPEQFWNQVKSQYLNTKKFVNHGRLWRPMESLFYCSYIIDSHLVNPKMLIG